MKPINIVDLAESTETGTTGILHLKRLWSKAIAGPDISKSFKDEWSLDTALMDVLGLGLLPTFQYLYTEKPSFDDFEQWVIRHSDGGISSQTIQLCKDIFSNNDSGQQGIEEAVLTDDDISFWNEQGYVVIKNAIPEEDCAASRKAIWDYLEMNEHDSATWYQHFNAMQGIMVPLYREASLDMNRYSPRIRKAFEQLWNQSNLVVTTDKCGFNPPETESFKFLGTGLHWDVSLVTPIPFGTQGILYLTDTAANQGALTVVPGFHKTIHQWLATLPEQANPRETDFSIFNPLPIAANAGDFIIWNHMLPHGSSPNRATSPRLVQYINWYSPVQKRQEIWI